MTESQVRPKQTARLVVVGVAGPIACFLSFWVLTSVSYFFGLLLVPVSLAGLIWWVVQGISRQVGGYKNLSNEQVVSSIGMSIVALIIGWAATMAIALLVFLVLAFLDPNGLR